MKLEANKDYQAAYSCSGLSSFEKNEKKGNNIDIQNITVEQLVELFGEQALEEI